MGLDGWDLAALAAVAGVVWGVARLCALTWGESVELPVAAVLVGGLVLAVYVLRETRVAGVGGKGRA